MKLRILRKHLGPNAAPPHRDTLQMFVNIAKCTHPGCMVQHTAKWEWEDVPVVDADQEEQGRQL